MQQRFLGQAKSLVGTTLLGLGIFLQYEHLDRAAVQLSHLFRTASGEALGVLPTAILAISRVLQSYASNNQCFLHDLLLYILVLSWPLLLVVVGTVLSRDILAENGNPLSKHGCRGC